MKPTVAKINTIEAEIYKEVLRDVSANFDVEEEFIKQRIEEIYDRNKYLGFFIYKDLFF